MESPSAPPRQRTHLAAVAVTAALFLLAAIPASAASRTVRIGIFPAAPLVFERDGKVTGLFMELADYFARELGWQLEYVRGTWDVLQRGLETGDIDLLPALGYTEARARTTDFNKHPIYIDSGVIFTSHRFPLRTVFDLEGRTIAAVRGSIFTEGFRSYTASFGISCEILLTEDNPQVMQAIASGDADAGVCIYSLGTELAREYPVRVTPINFSPIALHFAVRKGANRDVLEGIDRLMAGMVDDADSFYSRVFMKWTHPEPRQTIPAWVWFILMGIALAGSAFAAWSLSLRNQVEIKTRSLTVEVQERIRAEAKLRETLMQKEALLRELTHRTGNSIQLVKSLIAIKAADFPAAQAVGAFAENLAGKLDAIILAQQLLSDSDDFTTIDFRDYVDGLARTVLSELGRDGGSVRVRTEVTIPPLALDIAIPLGLALNELVSNSLRHGIPEGQEGTLTIEAFEPGPGRLCLRYADDGLGLPPGIDIRAQTTTGFRLILALVEGQLKGAISFQTDPGLRYSLEVPTDLYRPRIEPKPG